MVGKKIIIAVAAIWDKRKGLDDVVELSKMINDQIIVVGVSEEQKKTLPANILAYTRTDSVEELRKLNAVADVFINPTYEDNFPTTNIEALACGTPVITYDTGGSPEAAGEVAGSKIIKGEVEALVNAVDRLAVSPSTCVRQSHKYTKEQMTRQYLPII